MLDTSQSSPMDLAEHTFVSMIKVDGMRIPIAPYISEELKKQIAAWQRKAVAIEENLRKKQDGLILQKSKLHVSKIGSVPAPARSANFEERPQSRSVSSDEVVRKALNSAAYHEQQGQMLAGMLKHVTIQDIDDSQDSSMNHTNGEMAASESVNSGEAIPSASSTDLEPYISKSSPSGESASTVRPETVSDDNAQNSPRIGQTPTVGISRGSYTIEQPSAALLEHSNAENANDTNSNKPQFGHLGSMVARYLTEQQRAKNLSEYAKLQSILQEDFSKTDKAQTENPSANVTISKAGIKRRRSGENERMRATGPELIAAAIRGYLVRRVMQTTKVQHWIQTIRDCRKLLAPDTVPQGTDWRSLVDSRFQEQVSSQLEAALEEFNKIMFEMPIGDRLALIAMDQAPRPHSGHGHRPISKPRVSIGASAAALRNRSVSASHLLPNQNLKLNLKNAIDANKKRRLGFEVAKPIGGRPSTSSGQQVLRGASASTAQLSNASARPNTAAPSMPETRSKRNQDGNLALPNPAPPQDPATNPRRAAINQAIKNK